MNLSIIIVNFNTQEFLKKCLVSIKQSEIRNKRSLLLRSWKLEIIIVDNASTDGSVEMIKKLKTGKTQKLKIKLIENKENLGFAKAVNQGVRQAKGECLLLLNPDTIVKRGALEAMVDFVRTRPLTGVVGGRLLNQNGTLQGSCYHFPTISRALKEYWLSQKGAYEKYAVTGTDPVSVEAVTGAVMLIPRKIIEKIGLFDERYFMYFEDLDYCRRVKKAGLKVFYLPAAEIIHQHGVSGPPPQTYQYSVASSKIYNGIVKYYLLTFIIWLGQKWQKILKF